MAAAQTVEDSGSAMEAQRAEEEAMALREAAAQRPPTAGLIYGRCFLCYTDGEVLPCAFCEKASCASCMRQCEACQDMFCTFCSTPKYVSGRREQRRVFSRALFSYPPPSARVSFSSPATHTATTYTRSAPSVSTATPPRRLHWAPHLPRKAGARRVMAAAMAAWNGSRRATVHCDFFPPAVLQAAVLPFPPPVPPFLSLSHAYICVSVVQHMQFNTSAGFLKD